MSDVALQGKRVFCRVDFNVPMEDGIITDDTRIRAALPTINYLIEQGAKVILASHMGRPKGEVKEDLRLTKVGEHLAKLLDKPVNKLEGSIGESVEKTVLEMNDGDVVLLENVRFHAGEEKNDAELAKSFAKLAEIFVNDAFGVKPSCTCYNGRYCKTTTSCVRSFNAKRVRCIRQSFSRA